MVGKEITPTEIGKHAHLIKGAQEDLNALDVLVCGHCLYVFHFIEEFRQHKQKGCQKENNSIRECNDTKTQIWAFLLWKAAHLNNKDSNSSVPTSWALYQTWVKMDDNLRETWIVAGKTIQAFAKISQGSLQEMPVKITKTVVNNNKEAAAKKNLQKETNAKTPKLPTLIKGQNSENDSPTKPVVNQKIVKKIPPKGKQTISSINRVASRHDERTNTVTQENVEHIVAKRLNSRRGTYDYLVKWENRKNEQNTWESLANLESVPVLLETFERLLQRQKETRAAVRVQKGQVTTGGSGAGDASSAASKNVDTSKSSESNKDSAAHSNNLSATKASHKLPTLNNSETLLTEVKTNVAATAVTDSMGRPARNSKLKALDQVKQWVSDTNVSARASPVVGGADGDPKDNDRDWPTENNNSGTGAISVGVKRKLPTDSDDLPSTTATIEDLEEDLIPSHTVKRMKDGNSVSVEVKTKLDKNVESKVIKVNGTTNRDKPVTGEILTAGPNSAEVILTQDTKSSGVVKKPGIVGRTNAPKTEAQIRVLSKGETAVSSSGIVRVTQNKVNSIENVGGGTEGKLTIQQRQTPIRVGADRQAPTSTVGNTQITAIPHRTQQIQRTPGGTTIQRKIVTTAAGGQQQQQIPLRGTIQMRTATTASIQQQQQQQQQTSPASGRIIIPRQTTTAVARPTATVTKTVTPEQKILQLSKSGDLKVTKKVMTREDAAAQRMLPQQRQQQLRQQQQSQVQIQKVQQIAPPTSSSSSNAGTAATARNTASITIRKQADTTYAHEDNQVQLCPITGKILGQEEPISQQPQQQQQLLQGGVLQTQIITDQHQQQQQQQQIVIQQEQQQTQQHQQPLQDFDPSLLLTGEQPMLTEDGAPILVTGEDGTVYQVAGKNAEGQTILVTQGPDGEQQFAYVATPEGDENQVLTLDSVVAEAVAHLPADQQAEAIAAAQAGEGQYIVKTTQDDGTTQVVSMTEAEFAQHQALQQQQQQQQQIATNNAAAAAGVTGQLCVQTSEAGDGQEANIPAEVVQADSPSPGGTRRVVLLLQDGTFMMTEMHDDEFKALNIAP